MYMYVCMYVYTLYVYMCICIYVYVQSIMDNDAMKLTVEASAILDVNFSFGYYSYVRD